MRYFLIVYDRSQGKILEQREYGPEERGRALNDRFRIEARERLRPDIEVVVLSASSEETLHKTHSRYFRTPEELATAGLQQASEG